MIARNSYSIEGSSAELACALRCVEVDLLACLPSLKASGLADVTVHGNGHVTLVSRRLLKEHKHRLSGRLRVEKHRERRRVTPNLPLVLDSGSDPDQGKEKKGVPPLNDLPAHLNTARMVKQWQIWMNVRRGLKKPKNWATMFNEQIVYLSQFTEPEAFEVLSASIRNGWQGLFKPQNYGNRNSNGGRSANIAHGENPRNVGVCKGPTDYGDAVRRKLAKEMAGEVAKTPSAPSATPDTGGKGV